MKLGFALVSFLVLTGVCYFLWEEFRDREPSVRALMIYAACEENEIDNYFHIDNPDGSKIIYERLEKLYPKFKLHRRNLARMAKGTKKELFHVSRRMGEAIYESCGSLKRSKDKANLFSYLMFKNARFSSSSLEDQITSQ